MSDRPFWEAWGGLEAKQASLKLAVGALAGVSAILGVTVIAMSRRAPTVVVLPEAREMREVKGEELSDRHYKDVGRAFIYTFGSWTFETVEDSFREASKMMSAKILGEFQYKTRRKVEEAKRSQLSESFIAAKENVVESKGGDVKVRIEGRRVVYVGKSVVSNEPYFYEVTIGRRARDLANPLGVEIVGIKQGPLAG